MGWVTDTYKEVYGTEIQNDNMEVFFARLYTDARDQMSDCVKPSWMAVDDFIITVVKIRTWIETKKFERGSWTVKHTEEIERFEIRTKSKDSANRIWWLAKHEKVTYEDLKAANEAKIF